MENISIYRIRENFNPHRPYFHKKDKLSAREVACLNEFFNSNSKILKKFPGISDENHFCVKVKNDDDKEDYIFETSYFVGATWLIEGTLPMFVEPKFDTEDGEIELDYFKILFDALKNIDNEFLDHVVNIDFEQKPISISQNQDLLSPILIIQYLHLLKTIVRKGLKKSYSKTEKNLKNKVRGKILVSQTIKKNHLKNKQLDTYCSYEKFGLDHSENRLLKKALNFSLIHLSNLEGAKSNLSALNDIIRYVQPAFKEISDNIELHEIKSFKPNALYKEYNEALYLAKRILRRFGYNISKRANGKIETPPFWINMSKLFELYLIQKLRHRYKTNEILYQPDIDGYFPDYLINSKSRNEKFVVDAKYKNYDFKKSLNIEDIRQVSGYARMTGVYDKLEADDNKMIDCLILYPSINNQKIKLSDEDLKLFQYRVSGYKNIYKIGINVPLIRNEY